MWCHLGYAAEDPWCHLWPLSASAYIRLEPQCTALSNAFNICVVPPLAISVIRKRERIQSFSETHAKPASSSMAGIEVAGLVLGGFSLVISAMEHYGTMEKMSRTWWKLKREHKRDLGRLRDCELMYRANIRTLLAPLELDGTIDNIQLETLLADLGDNGWQDNDVDAVLVRRLGERKERYFENLREMNSTIVKLAKVSMALDKEFQRSLERGTQVSVSADILQDSVAMY